MKFCFFAALIFFSIQFQAHSAMRAALDGVIWQNSFTNPSVASTTGSQTLGKLSLTGRLDKKNKLWLGWQFLTFSSQIKVDTVTSTISTFDMGPHFAFDFGSEKIYSLGFFYGIKNTSTFNNGTSSVALSGSSMNFSGSINPMIGEDLGLMIGLNYYLATYTTSTVSNVQTGVSYTFANLIPTLGLRYIW